jgi:hypothetical protein
MVLGKKFIRPHLNGKRLGVVVPAYHPSYGRQCKIGRCQPEQKNEILSPK